MPSERFFYRPVPPNYGAIGAGIGGGLERGVQNYLNERDRKTQRGREEEERNVWLDTMGGGQGEPPLQAGMPKLDYTSEGSPAGAPGELDFGKPGLARSRGGGEPAGGGGGGQGNILTRDVNLGGGIGSQPAPGPVETVARQDPYRQYTQISDDAYIENTGSRETRLAEEDMQRRLKYGGMGMEQEWEFSERERARDKETGIAAIMAQNPGYDRMDAENEYNMLDSNLANYRDLHPVRTSSSGGGMTANQYLDEIKENFEIYDQDGPTGEYELPMDEMIDMAEARARGEDVRIPTRQEARDRAWAGLANRFLGEYNLGPPGMGPDIPTAGADESAETPADMSPFDPQYIESIRTALSPFPRDDWERILTEDGADPILIDKILGR